MKTNEFKLIIANIFEPALVPLGYEMLFDPPGYDEAGNVWFEKILPRIVYLVNDFQPSGIKPHNVSSFTINLARNNPSYTSYRNKDVLPGYFLGERLAPAIWIEDRHAPDWTADFWWHFQSEEDLREVCKDALHKLLTYGVPYLENLDSNSIRLGRQDRGNGGLHGDTG